MAKLSENFKLMLQDNNKENSENFQLMLQDNNKEIISKVINGDPRSYPTPAGAALTTVSLLTSRGMYSSFVPVIGKDPILSQAEYDIISTSINENSLCSNFIEIVSTKIDPSLILLDTQLIKWLPFKFFPLNHYSKPDITCVHKAFITVIDFNSTAATPNGEKEKELKLRHTCLFRAITLIDAKLKDTNEAIGELINHVSQLCEFVNVHYNIFLIHKLGIVLLEFWDGHPQKITNINWRDPGSLDLFFSKLICPDPLSVVVKDCCEFFRIDLENIEFLGHGKDAYVFSVYQNTNGIKFRIALKVVISENNSDHLEKIVSLMSRKKDIFDSPNFPFVRVQNYEYRKCVHRNVTIGAGILLVDVGTPLHDSDVMLEKLYNDALLSLNTLHKSGFSHGDARQYNALVVNHQVKWTDPVYSSFNSFSIENCKSDMKSFILSIIRPSAFHKFKPFIDSYDYNNVRSFVDVAKLLIGNK